MIDEQELINLMTKSGEAYFSDNTEEGTMYAKMIIQKLDFSEKRDQDALLTVLVNALIRHYELSVLDELHTVGFDFNMKFKDGYTLPLFFSRYPKLAPDDKIYKKMTEYGAASLEDCVSVKKLHDLFEKNLRVYNYWWEVTVPFHDSRCSEASKEQNQTVLELVRNISNSSAEMIGDKGISIFHHLVWHNFYEAAEMLLKNGVNPNIKGMLGKGCNDKGYQGTTPLHLACFMGNYKMVKLLVDNGADTTICDDLGRTCFYYLSTVYIENILNAITGQTESIEQRFDIIPLLKCGINTADNCGITPILYLLQNDRSCKFAQTFLQKYIEIGADITAADENGNTALMLAAENNQVTAAMNLLKYKEMLNLQNKDGNTALHIAAQNYNFEISYALLDFGADYLIKNNNGETAEEIIKNGNDTKLINRLGKKRCEAPNVLAEIINNTFFYIGRDDNDRFPFALYLIKKMMNNIDEDDDEEIANVVNILHNALQEDTEGKVIETILNSGFDVTMPISYQCNLTNIRDYCLNPFFGVEIIHKLLDFGIDMNFPLIKGKTPANIVARLENENSITVSCLGEKPKKQIDYYAEAAKLFDVESMMALDNEGKSALHWAAQHNHIEMMKVMLAKGADVNITEDSEKMAGTTPLQIACIYGKSEMVKLLLENGADDSMMNVSGNTAAHYAVKEIESYIKVDYEKRAEIVELLEHIDIPRDDGKTPLILLQTYYNNYNTVNEITPILIDKGADVNHADNDGNTALMIHIDRHGIRNIVKEFIRAGADLNAQNHDGNTALHFALKEGNVDVARLLIKKGADYEIANNDGETPVNIAVENGYETVLALMV